MKTLFEDAACAEVMERLDRLTPQSAAVWGKMNVAQALAHCVVAMEIATGDWAGAGAALSQEGAG